MRGTLKKMFAKGYLASFPHKKDHSGQDFEMLAQKARYLTAEATGIPEGDIMVAFVNSPYYAFDTSSDEERLTLQYNNPAFYKKQQEMGSRERYAYNMLLFLNDALEHDPTLSHFKRDPEPMRRPRLDKF